MSRAEHYEVRGLLWLILSWVIPEGIGAIMMMIVGLYLLTRSVIEDFREPDESPTRPRP